MDLANWALRTSTKFTTGVKYQFQQGLLVFRNIRMKIILENLIFVFKMDVNDIGKIHLLCCEVC